MVAEVEHVLASACGFTKMQTAYMLGGLHLTH
jgi:hypothetical protein